MYKLFLRTETGDDYLGPFTTLKQCERGAEIKLDIMRQMYGIKKASFYCLDEKVEKTVGWVLGIKEEWQ